MIQWMLRKTIWFMGLVYVTLDKFVKYEDSDKILGITIDDDFQRMTRRELCNYVEFKFGWDEGSFW